MYLKLKPEIKAKWLAALRSGDYAQGKSRLVTVSRERDPEDGVLQISQRKYCCLGVLADLAVQDGVGAWNDHFEARSGCSVFTTEGMRVGAGEKAVLPPAVVLWAFADVTEAGSEDHGNQNPQISDTQHAADANDGGASFGQIADLIEQHL